MTVAYDATGAGLTGANVTGSGVAYSFAHTAALGADIFVAIEVNYTGAPSSVQYNGAALTLLASVSPNNNGTYGSVNLYRGAAMGTGSSANVSFTIPATTYFVAASVSYTGVGSVGAAVTAYGSGTALSSGALSCTSGQMIVCAIGAGSFGHNANTVASPTGGTNRSALNQGAYVGQALSDSAASATFGASTSSSTYWASIGVVLSAGGPPPSSGPGGMPALVIPNPNVGPMALRKRKRMPYVGARCVSGPAPVAFDALGAGYCANPSGTTGSWIHTAQQGSYVVVPMHVFINENTYGGVVGVTYGGQAMTPLYTVFSLNNAQFGMVTFYGLPDVPGGPQTVEFTLETAGATSHAVIIANSLSYTGVGSVSPFAWPGYGLTADPISLSVAGAENSVTLAAFAVGHGALTY